MLPAGHSFGFPNAKMCLQVQNYTIYVLLNFDAKIFSFREQNWQKPGSITK